MKKIAVIAAGLVVLLSGCSGNSDPFGSNIRDLENIPATDPQKAELYVNIDGHPNLVRICIDDKAFITTTRKGGAAWRRAEYFDDWCVGELQ